MPQAPTRPGRPSARAGRITADTAAFFADHHLLLCPATITPPFPIEQRWLETLNGHRFDTYVDWLLIASAITLTGCPALSLPCGFTRDGLPVGLQMVGPPRGEATLLAVAAMLEDALDLKAGLPIDPRIERFACAAAQAFSFLFCYLSLETGLNAEVSPGQSRKKGKKKPARQRTR